MRFNNNPIQTKTAAIDPKSRWIQCWATTLTVAFMALILTAVRTLAADGPVQYLGRWIDPQMAGLTVIFFLALAAFVWGFRLLMGRSRHRPAQQWIRIDG